MKFNHLKYVGMIGGFIFIITTVIGGYVFDGYSHISQYISESYASGTEYGYLLRWYGYVPSGLMMLVFCFFNARLFKNCKYIVWGFVGFGIFYGLLTSLVSIFPCDFGCNRNHAEPSFSQLMHTIMSVLTYIMTPLSIYLIGYGFRTSNKFEVLSNVSNVLSLAGLVFGIIFLTNADSAIAGLIQRMTESIYLSWLMLCSLLLIQKNVYAKH